MSYTPSASLAGRLLRATVIYDDATGRGRKAASKATAALDQRGTVTLSSGAPVVGEVITATLTDADGSIANEVWKWERSPDQKKRIWSTIANADSMTYTSVADDAGKLLRAKVTYDDGVGTGRTVVSGATAAVDQRGAVTLAPGTPVVGEAVTATLMDADGSVTNEVWKWERAEGTGESAWSVISGATSASYTPVAGDDAGKKLRATVTYDDGTGEDRSATSAASERVDRRGVVTLNTTVPDVGVRVVATLADQDGGMTGETWKWQSSPSMPTPAWSDISNAASTTYTVVIGDEGKLLRAMVSYGDAIGSGRSAVSMATLKVGKAGVVSLDSTAPVVGELLTATLADGDGSVANEAWVWESSPWQKNPVWSAIDGATASSYTPLDGDAGRLLRATVSYSDGSGVGRTARSGATRRVDTRGSVTVAPDPPVVGKSVRATLSDADGSITNEVWKWERSPETGNREWSTISGARSNSYRPTAADDAGKLLRAAVTYDDGVGTGRSATSGATKRVDREGVVTLSPSPPVAGEIVTGTLADADGNITNEAWKWERSVRTGNLHGR